MKSNSSLLHIGLDVDDKSFHGGAFSLATGEVFLFQCKPTIGALMKQLQKIQESGHTIKLCYEASYIGTSLYRDLRAHQIACEIIAPSLIPTQPGKPIKTDRLDSIRMAKYYAKDLLTPIHILSEEEEQDRDLIRARQFLVRQRQDFKRHILSTCRRLGLNYRQATDGKEYWTLRHRTWLVAAIKQQPNAVKMLLEELMLQLENLNDSITRFDDRIKEMAGREHYQVRCSGLECFRGVGTLSAMTVLTEIGDVRRFAHPKNLTSYAGMDIREYSSGGKERKYGITKMGNRRIRTAVIEGCQNIMQSSQLSRRLQASRKGQSPKIVKIAVKCDERLKKKARRMHLAGKHINKIKMACAREKLCFIWEMLQQLPVPNPTAGG